jgi:predicted transcriptional regulator
MNQKKTKSESTVPLPIRVSVNLRDKLRKVALAEDRSIGWILRLAAEEFLERWEKKNG